MEGGETGSDQLAVAILGVGRMGAQIGLEYSLAGHPVTFVARDRERAEHSIAQALAVAHEATGSGGELLCRQRIVTAPEDIPEATGLIVESLPEDLDLKVAMLGRAARARSRAMLASNTSSLSITGLGRAIDAGERLIGTHYWNPPLLMPLVELVVGADTNLKLVDEMERILITMRKQPIRVRDVPGFVWNRLQLALLREALWLVENGVADPEGIDAVVRDGLARRWRLAGPFETVALGGASTFETIANNLFPVLSTADQCRGFDGYVPTGPEVLGAIGRRRDLGLIAELRRSERRAASDARDG